jgi:hypothetical protein
MAFKRFFRVRVEFMATGPQDLASVMCEIDRRLNDNEGLFTGRVVEAQEIIEKCGEQTFHET